MAGRSATTFKKRQKEQARQEKQREKAAKREARKQEEKQFTPSMVDDMKPLSAPVLPDEFLQ